MTASGQELSSAPPPAPALPGPETSLGDWLEYLEAGHGRRIELGLERCQEVAGRLGLERPAPTVVTVAGTNGKGSSVALLDLVWRTAGRRVGTYTSPHLLRFNERIRIDGAAASDTRICSAFSAVEAARGDVPLTYFEFATLAALKIFSESGLDLVILEVGLGGRLDAVNIIDADIALIAAIDLDHEDWLGNTREQIALEKGGIMRPDTPAVCSDHAVPISLVEAARKLGSRLSLLGAEFAFQTDGDSWTWWSGDAVLENLPMPALGGMHQIRNAAGALMVVHTLRDRIPVGDGDIRAALASAVLPARFQRIEGEIEHIIDVAHNPQAATIFAEMLPRARPGARTHALIGMLNTKNHREVLRPLTAHVDRWYFADLEAGNGAPADTLVGCLNDVAPRADAGSYPSPRAAYAAVKVQAQPGDRVLVLGSFLTAGAVIQMLSSNTDETN